MPSWQSTSCVWPKIFEFNEREYRDRIRVYPRVLLRCNKRWCMEDATQCNVLHSIVNGLYHFSSSWLNTPTEGKDQLCLAQQKFRVGMDGHHPKLPLPSNYPQTQCLVQRQWRLKHVRGSCRRWNSLLQHEPRSSLDHPIVYQCLTNREQQDKRSRHQHQVKGTVLANLDGNLYQKRRFRSYQSVMFNDSFNTT